MVYNVSGETLNQVYKIDGTATTAYNINGEEISGFSTFLDAFKYAYRRATSESGVHLFAHTDEHGRFISSNTTLTGALSWLAENTSNLSACIGLGDVCGNVYNETQLTAYNTVLSVLPSSKRIDIGGNHDVWYVDTTPPTVVTDWDTWLSFFDNSAYNGFHAYDKRNNAYMIDETNKIKYVTVSSWYWNEGARYYQYNFSPAADYLINALSTEDDYDIVVLSHIQPLSGSHPWTVHAVADNAESTATKSVSCLGTSVGLNDIISARKAKTSGTWTDSDGITHSYDFTNCTSDLICWFSGHEHLDEYTSYGNVPVILLSSYLTSPYALYFISITDTNISIWKMTESKTVYNYVVSLN